MTKPELENKFLETISDRLEDTELSCEDIKTLSDAFANLTRDDYLKNAFQALKSDFILPEIEPDDEEEKNQKS